MHIIAWTMDTIRPHLPWIIAAAAGVLVLGGALFLLLRMIAQRKHDRALKAEALAEATREAPSALDAEVTVIPVEALPQDGNRIFMPIPAKVSEMVDFVREGRDGITLRSCMPADDADGFLTDGQAVNLRRVIYRDGVCMDDCAYVSVDVLSTNFAPYSYVSLDILKKHGFVEEHMTALSVRAEGVLRKPLMIEANEFTLTAVKMISLVGGRAIEVRPTKKG